MSMQRHSVAGLVATLVISGMLGAGWAGVAEEGLAGVVSVKPVLEHSYVAAPVSVPLGHAITGVRWFNNDHATVFPRVCVVAAAEGRPDLDHVLACLADVAGPSEGWAEIALPEPVLGSGEGVFVAFQLPALGERTGVGAGGGPGIGYRTQPAGESAWLSLEGEEWVPLDGGVGLAVEAVVGSGQQLSSVRPPWPAPGDGVELEAPAVAYRFELLPIAPNPTNPRVVIRFTLDRPGLAQLTVIDARGRRIARPLAAELDAGAHVVEWNGTDEEGHPVASGAYYVILEAGGQATRRPVILVR